METHGIIECGEAIGMTEGDVHRLLATERRRLAFDVLAERGGSMGVRELASVMVERERADASTDDVRMVTIDLYHRHLPLMAELGAVEFDPRTERVEACLEDVRTS